MSPVRPLRFVSYMLLTLFLLIPIFLGGMSQPAYANTPADLNMRLPWSSVSYPISRAYQCQNTHVDAADRFAIDFDLPKGTPLTAAFAGTVWVGPYDAGGFGYNLWIQNGNWRAIYAHMDGSNIILMHGQQVQAGQVIGKVSNSGNVIPGPGGDGSHLHFALRDGGSGSYDGMGHKPEPMSGYESFDVGCNPPSSTKYNPNNDAPGGVWASPTPANQTSVAANSPVLSQ